MRACDGIITSYLVLRSSREVRKGYQTLRGDISRPLAFEAHDTKHISSAYHYTLYSETNAKQSNSIMIGAEASLTIFAKHKYVLAAGKSLPCLLMCD